MLLWRKQIELVSPPPGGYLPLRFTSTLPQAICNAPGNFEPACFPTGPSGSSRPRSSVRFEEQSPATTPSWKSNSWNRGPSQADPGRRSPDVKAGPDGEVTAEWEQAGEQVPPPLTPPHSH